MLKLLNISQSVQWTAYRLGDWRSIPNRDSEGFFLFATVSRQILGPNQPPT